MKKISFGVSMIGAFFILLSIFFALLIFIYHMPEGYEVALPPVVTIPSMILYFITGLGLIRLKKMARIFGIVLLLLFTIFSAFYAHFFLSFAILELFNLQPGTKVFIYPPPDNYKEIGPFITIGVIRDIVFPSIFISSIIICFILIYYLTRPKVKEQFK